MACDKAKALFEWCSSRSQILLCSTIHELYISFYFQSVWLTYKEILQFFFFLKNEHKFYVLPQGMKFCKHFHLLMVSNTWEFCRHYRCFHTCKLRINVEYKGKLSKFQIYLCFMRPGVPLESALWGWVCSHYVKYDKG